MPKPRSKPIAAPSPTVCDIEEFSPSAAVAIRASLLGWYDVHRRDLPWRRRSSAGDEERRAYVVWVSEVMLQQTRVAVVVDYYRRWMERWPDVESLAVASQEEVNEMWAGLGYYRRARYLLEGAKSIVKQKDFPRTAASLRKVCGIGDYTAGAIASIAFNEAVPVVDGNVVRVMSRLKAISANPKETSTVKAYWKLASQLVDPSRPGDFNQALMELGATLCSKTNPSCSECPISSNCQALYLAEVKKSAKVTDFPSKVLKAKPRNDFAAICVIQLLENSCEGTDAHKHFLLVKRPEEGLLAGLWEFPAVLVNEEKTDQATRRRLMDKYLKESLDLDLKMYCDLFLRADVGEHLHIFSHIRLQMFVEQMILTLKVDVNKLKSLCEQSSTAVKFVDESTLESLGLTSGIRKVYNMIKGSKETKTLLPTKRKLKRTRLMESQ